MDSELCDGHCARIGPLTIDEYCKLEGVNLEQLRKSNLKVKNAILWNY